MAERIIQLDFTGVEGGAMFVRVPEGDYAMKINKVESKKGKESGKPNLLFQFKLTKGNAKGVGKVVPHNCSLQKQSLWNLRNLMEACGKQVPSKALKINLDKMVGWECAGTVIDDEYEGKKKSVISAFFPLDDLGATSESPEEVEGGEETEEGDEEELFS